MKFFVVCYYCPPLLTFTPKPFAPFHSRIHTRAFNLCFVMIVNIKSVCDWNKCVPSIHLWSKVTNVLVSLVTPKIVYEQHHKLRTVQIMYCETHPFVRTWGWYLHALSYTFESFIFKGKSYKNVLIASIFITKVTFKWFDDGWNASGGHVWCEMIQTVFPYLRSFPMVVLDIVINKAIKDALRIPSRLFDSPW